MGSLLHKHEIYGTNNEEESQHMIPVNVLSLKHDIGYNGEDHQADALLDNLELYQTEWSSIGFKSYAVGRHLTAIFEECYSPRKCDNTDERP